MGREKENYRATLQFLSEKYPMLMAKIQVAEALGISRTHLDKVIRKGHIKVQDDEKTKGKNTAFFTFYKT